jgi:hypothetical protein
MNSSESNASSATTGRDTGAGTGADWYPDPMGRADQRYWDGTRWTEHISRGGQQFSDPLDRPSEPRPSTVPPSTVPVRGVATVAAPTKRKKWPWILGAVVLAMVLGFAGCVALVGGAAVKVADQLDQEQKAHAITKEQFDSVQLGTSRAQVVDQLAKQPEDSQEFVTKGVLNESDVNSSCIYYNRAGGSFGARFQFCFDNDALTAKNAY